jgi:hypothetical protein
MTVINHLFGHKAEPFITLPLIGFVFWFGFRWVRKKQRSERGFLYKLLLVLQIFFFPFLEILWIDSTFNSLIDPFSIETIYTLIFLTLVIHGAYWGVRLLTVTEESKKGMKLNLLLRFIFALWNATAFYYTHGINGELFDFLPSMWVAQYVTPILGLLFLFSYYQFIFTLKNDELDVLVTESVEGQS